MALAVNSAIFKYAAQVTLEGSGGSAASNAFVAADDAQFDSTNHFNAPLADFVLKCDFGAAVAPGTTVNLYRMDNDIDSTNDPPVPSTTYKYLYVGSFVLPSGQSATAYYPLTDVPLAQVCKFYIENATAQNLSAGWTLKATPKTTGPST